MTSTQHSITHASERGPLKEGAPQFPGVGGPSLLSLGGAIDFLAAPALSKEPEVARATTRSFHTYSKGDHTYLVPVHGIRRDGGQTPGMMFIPGLYEIPNLKEDWRWCGTGVRTENQRFMFAAYMEIDNCPLPEQWARIFSLPQVAHPNLVTFSGNKSLHPAWSLDRLVEPKSETFRLIQLYLCALLDGDPHLKGNNARCRAPGYQGEDREQPVIYAQRGSHNPEKLLGLLREEAKHRGFEVDEAPKVVSSSRGGFTFLADSSEWEQVVEDGRSRQDCPWCGGRNTLVFSPVEGSAYCHHVACKTSYRMKIDLKAEGLALDSLVEAELVSGEEVPSGKAVEEAVEEVELAKPCLMPMPSTPTTGIGIRQGLVEKALVEELYTAHLQLLQPPTQRCPEPWEILNEDPPPNYAQSVVDTHLERNGEKGFQWVSCPRAAFYKANAGSTTIRKHTGFCNAYRCSTCGDPKLAMTTSSWVAFWTVYEAQNPGMEFRGFTTERGNFSNKASEWAKQKPGQRVALSLRTSPTEWAWVVGFLPGDKFRGDLNKALKGAEKGSAKDLSAAFAARLDREAWLSSTTDMNLIAGPLSIRQFANSLRKSLFQAIDTREDKSGEGAARVFSSASVDQVQSLVQGLILEDVSRDGDTLTIHNPSIDAAQVLLTLKKEKQLGCASTRKEVPLPSLDDKDLAL
jgi:hypothetical protein